MRGGRTRPAHLCRGVLLAQLRRAGREHEQLEVALPTGLLEGGGELPATVHLQGADGEGRVKMGGSGRAHIDVGGGLVASPPAAPCSKAFQCVVIGPNLVCGATTGNPVPCDSRRALRSCVLFGETFLLLAGEKALEVFGILRRLVISPG